MTLEKRASLDVAAVARLCKERDDLLQTLERLCSECSALMRSATRLSESVTRPTKSG